MFSAFARPILGVVLALTVIGLFSAFGQRQFWTGLGWTRQVWAEDAPAPAPGSYQPPIAERSPDAQTAISRFQLPPGYSAKLFAAEPDLANPVAFWIDHQGQVYVAETFRHTDGATDNRSYMHWLDDDLAAKTVADRVAMFRKHLKDDVSKFEQEQDRVRLLADLDHDLVADRSTVFADGFGNLADGIGAGLLSKNGKVYYACIPDLWQLEDTDADGQSDTRKSLHTGYGVHVAFIGHDLHGLRLGPDGRLYFSIGDRGLHVETSEGTVSYPDAGAVLRCEPDGSHLELVATGLRNPQELVFDEFGNLFTCDNNSDSGDQARCVYVVEGGDSGWRIGFQYLNEPYSRGPWNQDQLWKPAFLGQAAYVVPPLANIADGPSGLAYYPGTGWGDEPRGQFFLCDFRGASATSGVQTFRLAPQGAAFEVQDFKHFAWQILATDCDFGPDGALYISDWVEGWEKPKKGRIYRIVHESASNSPLVAEVRQLLGEGLQNRTLPELGQLLAHADQRVRQESQFALVDRGHASAELLMQTALNHENLLARLHGIWGLAQLNRQQPGSPIAVDALVPLLADPAAEVRSQAAKALGDAGCTAAVEPLTQLVLQDTEPRVRFFAAMALGKLKAAGAAPAILRLLKDNADKDPYLRHAAVMALTGMGDLAALLEASRDASPSVRLGVLLTLRRLAHPEIARFLDDPEPRLVVEAARAIYDVPIAEAMPPLANLVERGSLPEAALYRALCANQRLRTALRAQAVARFAARDDMPETLRVEALRILAEWSKPSGRDRVTGLWRPMQPAADDLAEQALSPAWGGLFRGPDRVRQEAVQLASTLGITDIGPLLFEQLARTDRPWEVRVSAFQALAHLKDARLEEALQLALSDEEARLRAAGLTFLAASKPEAGLALVQQTLENGTTVERQAAATALATLPGPSAEDLLLGLVDQLAQGTLEPALMLETLESARQRGGENLTQRLTQWEAGFSANDPLAAYRPALAGGYAGAGEAVFFHKMEVSCVRCHKVNGRGGEVGPDLFDVGKKQKREYLLQALVDPSGAIAKGFESVILETSDGLIHTGVLRAEDETTLTLMTAEGKKVVLDKSTIDTRSTGKSAMPDTVVKALTLREIRDLVEFLSSQSGME